MGSKIFGTVFDLLDKCTRGHQLAGFDIHVNRADLTPVTGGGHRENDRDTPVNALADNQPWFATMHISADLVSDETSHFLLSAERGNVHRSRKMNINRQLARSRR